MDEIVVRFQWLECAALSREKIRAMKLQIPFGLMLMMFVVGVALWAISTLPRPTLQPPATPRSTSNAVSTLTIGPVYNDEDKLFSISNRAWMRMQDGIIVRATDSEWDLLTNMFPKHVRTNTINIFK